MPSIVTTTLLNENMSSFEEVQRLESVMTRKRSFSRTLRCFFSSLTTSKSKRQKNFNERSSSLGPDSVPLKGAKRQSVDELWAICCQLALNEPLYNAEVSNTGNMFRKQRLRINLKKLDNTIHELQLPPPASEGLLTGEGGVVGESLRDFVSQLPLKCRKISVKADPSGLVARLLPANCVSKEARYVGSAFWLWLCAIDDLTEDLQGEAYEEALQDVRNGFKGVIDENSPSDVGIASKAFYELVNCTRIYHTIIKDGEEEDHREHIWRASLLNSVCEILCAFDAERPLLRTKTQGKNIGLRDWMKVRVVTISARPFMVLARASLGIPTTLTPRGYPITPHDVSSEADVEDQHETEKLGTSSSCESSSTYGAESELNETLDKIEIITQCIMGLQNDILGWEKDHMESNPLNAIEILISQGLTSLAAMTSVIAVHNNLVDRAVKFATLLVQAERSANESRSSKPFTSCAKTSLEHASPSLTLVSSIASEDYRSNVSTASFSSQGGHIRGYVEMLLGFSNGMAAWSASCKRYAVV